MPPKTLDVMRHRAGARSTESPNGHRVFSMTIRSAVASTTVKPPSMACLRRTKQRPICSGVIRPTTASARRNSFSICPPMSVPTWATAASAASGPWLASTVCDSCTTRARRNDSLPNPPSGRASARAGSTLVRRSGGSWVVVVRRGTGRTTDTTMPALARTEALTAGASAVMICSPRPESASSSSSASASTSRANRTPAGAAGAARSVSASKPGPMS